MRKVNTAFYINRDNSINPLADENDLIYLGSYIDYQSGAYDVYISQHTKSLIVQYSYKESDYSSMPAALILSVFEFPQKITLKDAFTLFIDDILQHIDKKTYQKKYWKYSATIQPLTPLQQHAFLKIFNNRISVDELMRDADKFILPETALCAHLHLSCETNNIKEFKLAHNIEETTALTYEHVTEYLNFYKTPTTSFTP